MIVRLGSLGCAEAPYIGAWLHYSMKTLLDLGYAVRRVKCAHPRVHAHDMYHASLSQMSMPKHFEGLSNVNQVAIKRYKKLSR